ncbi:MAG: hypothetical protein NC830_07020 [Candidatus Omnitrophica bacterium]|nr:hypothetical protein [Candidatus Omnitrophota bacterium]
MKMNIAAMAVFLFAFVAYSQEIHIPQQKLQKNLENEVLVRLINDIEIKDNQMPEFISRFRQICELIQKYKQTKEEVIGGIPQQNEEEITTKKIGGKIEHLDKLSQQINDDIKKIRNEMMKFLSPKQQIKLALMMDDIMQQLLKMPPLPPHQIPFIPDVSR